MEAEYQKRENMAVRERRPEEEPEHPLLAEEKKEDEKKNPEKGGTCLIVYCSAVYGTIRKALLKYAMARWTFGYCEGHGGEDASRSTHYGWCRLNLNIFNRKLDFD